MENINARSSAKRSCATTGCASYAVVIVPYVTEVHIVNNMAFPQATNVKGRAATDHKAVMDQ